MTRRALLVALAAAAALLAGSGPAFARRAGRLILIDDIDDWQVEWFCGNPNNAHFVQGPRFESAAGGRIVFDGQGNAYLACGTFIEFVPRKGPVRILAGTPGLKGCTDGPPWKASFSGASDIALADDDTLYVLDSVAFAIRRLRRRPDGRWFTETVAGVPGRRGHRDGPAKAALFDAPLNGLAVDRRGAVYVMSGDYLRRYQGGVVTTLNAGTGRADGPLRKAGFRRAMGGGGCLATDGRGGLYVADRWNMAVRKVDLEKGVVTTLAGVPPGGKWWGPHDGPALEARFHPGGGPCVVVFNPKYQFLLVKAADEGGRIRWIRDGWMKSFTPPRGKALVGPLRRVGGSPCGVDARGRCYLAGTGGIRVARKRKAVNQ